MDDKKNKVFCINCEYYKHKFYGMAECHSPSNIKYDYVLGKKIIRPPNGDMSLKYCSNKNWNGCCNDYKKKTAPPKIGFFRMIVNWIKSLFSRKKRLKPSR